MGTPPHTAWCGAEQAAWPARSKALEVAFAMHAAELESTTADLLDALGEMGKK